MASPHPIFINPVTPGWRYESPDAQTTAQQPDSLPRTLHNLLPHAVPTQLRGHPSLAKALGLGHVLLKDESARFGLPSFKMLGASWAVYRAVTAHLDLDARKLLAKAQRAGDLDLEGLGAVAKERGIDLRLVTCTAGNWGRALARMAGYMRLPAVVYVPSVVVDEARRERIRGEGAEVRVVEGGYKVALAAAQRAAEEEGLLLVVDNSWEGYEEVPKWVVEGYQTMLDEADVQVSHVTGGRTATHVIVPVGCGSVAQAVTQHFKSAARELAVRAAKVLSVEPDTAACLQRSLEAGEMTTVSTGESIMSGLNTGTVSPTAWPVLRSGVDASVTVSDIEAHHAVQELAALGIQAGPCGAATLAALKTACGAEREKLGLSESSVVVLFSTEGSREYNVPASL